MKLIFKITEIHFNEVMMSMMVAEKVDYYTVGEGMHNRLRDDHKLGYVVTEKSCQYTTSGLNTWGVRKEGDNFVAFFEGRRATIHKAMLALQLTESFIPAQYESSNPEMRWDESLFEFLTRTGGDSKYLAENQGFTHTSERIERCWWDKFGAKTPELIKLARRRYLRAN